LSVELQCFDRGAPDRGHADDQLETFIPSEVVLPTLLARMKQINQLICNGVS
jgi:hypothetical protein